MEKPKNKSHSKLEKNGQSFSDLISKKFKFLRSIKNYVLSKLRSSKYEIENCVKDEISIVSFEQRSFDEADKHLDIQSSSVIKIDNEIIKSLKEVLDSNSQKFKSKSNLELVDIVERTFSRQFDILEEMLKVMKEKNGKEDVKLSEAETLDNCVNDTLKNLVTQLKKVMSNNEASHSADLREIETLGDNGLIKNKDVDCECQLVTENGGAVPTF